MQPVSDPIFVTLWSEQLQKRNHDKPTALGTPFRFSDALNCPRRMVFDALGVPKSDPIDPAGLHVTTIGSWIHEQVQEAIGRKFPGARFELASGDETVSGSCDGLTYVGGVVGSKGKVLLELKTVGGFAFDKAVGVNRKAYKRGSPEGPRPSAIVQAGLNAIFHEADTVVVMYLAMEAISKQLADRVGFNQYDRFSAEWHIPREVWEPLAREELARIKALEACLDPEDRVIPGGMAFDDKTWEWKPISPNDSRPHWSCSYCAHVTTCIAHEAGVDVI